jgi:hypothetical protein
MMCVFRRSTTESSGELRKRNVSSKERAELYVDTIKEAAPAGLKPYLEKAKPIVGHVSPAELS